MFIPCLPNPFPVPGDDLPYSVKLFSSKTLISCQGHGLDPEFADHSFPLHMHMRSLVAVEAIKEEPVRPWNSADRWHINIEAISDSHA
jgi:hypothetical protein